MADPWWTGVRERVLAAPGDVFGALGHRWILHDPLTPDDLADLETQAGVRLPEEYRDFLLHIGAGGAGPAYGVFPVRRVDGRWRWEGSDTSLADGRRPWEAYGGDPADLTRLAEPFPVERPNADKLAELRRQFPKEEDFGSRDAFDSAYAAWEQRCEPALFAPERTTGAVVICHLGCGIREFLVVSGPQRGTIWSDTRVDDEPAYNPELHDLTPLRADDGTPMTFARWYLAWLEQAEGRTATG